MTPVWWNVVFAFSVVCALIGVMLWAGVKFDRWVRSPRADCKAWVTGPTGRRKAGSGRTK